MTKILLVDTNSIGSRAFFVGELQFFSMIGKVENVLQPDMTIFCFDSAENWRKKLYPEYKANRKPKDPTEADVKAKRIDYLRNLWTSLKKAGYNTLHVDGYEADDLLASLVTQLPQHEHYVLSGDKDIFALADRATVVWPGQPFSNWQLCGIDECVAITGVKPDQQALYRALVGESSDNIPGTPRIGKVTAPKLLNGDYPTYEVLLTHPKVVKYLDEFKLSYRLALLREDCFKAKFEMRQGDIQKAQQIYRSLVANV